MEVSPPKEERKGKESPLLFIIDNLKILKLYFNIIEQGFLFLEQNNDKKLEQKIEQRKSPQSR